MSNKISIVTAVMNRPDRVIQFVKSWYNNDIFDEIILVDWNSEMPLSTMKELQTIEKINIIRVDNKTEFNLGQAYNYGILSSKNELILKLDIDHVLGKEEFIDFLNKATKLLNQNKYVTGRGESKVAYHGFAFFTKTAFIESGMYNENLNGWGYDNEDLYNRMNNNFKEIRIKLNPLVWHNPHGDDLRVANYKEKKKEWSYEKNKMVVSNYLNKLG